MARRPPAIRRRGHEERRRLRRVAPGHRQHGYAGLILDVSLKVLPLPGGRGQPALRAATRRVPSGPQRLGWPAAAAGCRLLAGRRTHGAPGRGRAALPRRVPRWAAKVVAAAKPRVLERPAPPDRPPSRRATGRRAVARVAAPGGTAAGPSGAPLIEWGGAQRWYRGAEACGSTAGRGRRGRPRHCLSRRRPCRRRSIQPLPAPLLEVHRRPESLRSAMACSTPAAFTPTSDGNPPR